MKSIMNWLSIPLGSREKTYPMIGFSFAGPSSCPTPPRIALSCCVSCNSICRRTRLARPSSRFPSALTPDDETCAEEIPPDNAPRNLFEPPPNPA
jgi:hypothetical protein